MPERQNVDDYLMQGIYGKKEINPEERKRFLGTIRERIVLALTEKQIYESVIYSEVEREMLQHPNTKLLLNGKIPYDYLKKYIKIANKNNISFTIVENKEYDTDIGLVLAYEQLAIDKDEIFVQKPNNQTKEINNSIEGKKKTASSVKGFLKKLLK